MFRRALLTWLTVLTVVFAAFESGDFEITYGCDLTYGIVLETARKIRSVTECCRQCHRTIDCLSVKYDKVNSECHLNSHRHPLVDNTCQTEMFGYSGLIKSSNRKLINDDCAPSDECGIPNSRCYLNKCQCKPGYSYKHANESCVTECDDYGSTFTRDTEYALSGLNGDTLYETTPESCQQACVDETSFLCLTCEYHSASQNCYLAVATALTYPELYIPYPGYDIYHRNCQ